MKAYPTADPRNVKHLSTLGEVCSAIKRLPPSAALHAGLKKRGTMAVASGGLADIWQGERACKWVAIKEFRISTDNLGLAKQVRVYLIWQNCSRTNPQILWKRVPVWKKLSHENILPFHGVDTSLFRLGLVYDWGPNGNINQYIASHPHVSRPSLVWKTPMTAIAASC